MNFSLGRPAVPLADKNCRLMLVDGSVENLATMVDLFSPFGFALAVASTADEALEQATSFHPHAVYMGLEYHDCNGEELADRLRKVAGMEKAMLVGLCDRKHGWDSLDGKGSHGFDHYLPKPPRMADIVAALTRDVCKEDVPVQPDVQALEQH